VIEIRSYRRVFDLERRIYRVDRVRLNPGGVPVRAILYFLAVLGLALLAVQLPLLGLGLQAVPWYVRDIALPSSLAALLTVVRIEGRPFHLAFRSILRISLGSRRLTTLCDVSPRSTAAPGSVWQPLPLLMLPDGSEESVRRLRYTGPGALLITVAHGRRTRRGPLVWLGLRAHVSVHALHGAPRPSSGEVLVLERAARLGVS
jgi:hypothetical protein